MEQHVYSGSVQPVLKIDHNELQYPLMTVVRRHSN